jgi:hypothetical protein
VAIIRSGGIAAPNGPVRDKQAQYQMGVMAADGLGQNKILAWLKIGSAVLTDQGFAPARRRFGSAAETADSS